MKSLLPFLDVLNIHLCLYVIFVFILYTLMMFPRG